MHLRAVGLLLLPLLACAPKPAQPSDTPPQKVCTAMGCVNGLTLQLGKATPWPAGAYEFVFALDGTAVTCTGSLPLRPCEQGPSLTCNPADKVQVMESGCALPAEQHGWGDVHVEGEPLNVELTIRHGEAVLHSAELQPEYHTLQPNGPDCEPTCRSANVSTQVP